MSQQETTSDTVFSIIIPTYNGRNKIVPLLNSLFTTNYSFRFEIIVIIDGSTDDTWEAIRPFESKGVKIIVQENQGRAVTRNNGAKAASGNYLFFVDDDMRLEKGILDKHLLHHSSTPDSVLVGKVSMDASKFSKDFDFYIASLFAKWEHNYNGKILLNSSNLKFTTQHLSIPKTIFEKIGGFDQNLTDAEDYDLAMRLLDQNVPIFYDPSIIAYHDDFPTISSYINRQIEYRKSHQKLIEIGNEYTHGVFFPMREEKNKIKNISLKILASEKIKSWAEKEYFLFLPSFLRFKLYATIIYAHTLKGLKLL